MACFTSNNRFFLNRKALAVVVFTGQILLDDSWWDGRFMNHTSLVIATVKIARYLMRIRFVQACNRHWLRCSSLLSAMALISLIDLESFELTALFTT
jgi:hypothetical protein